MSIINWRTCALEKVVCESSAGLGQKELAGLVAVTIGLAATAAGIRDGAATEIIEARATLAFISAPPNLRSSKRECMLFMGNLQKGMSTGLSALPLERA